MSKDSASPSSADPENISAMSSTKIMSKITNYMKSNFWTSSLNNEEDPEVQSPPVISAANHQLYFQDKDQNEVTLGNAIKDQVENGKEVGEDNASSEMFDYSKDSALNGSKNLNELSINSSSIDLEFLKQQDTSQNHPNISNSSFNDKNSQNLSASLT